MPNTSDPVHTNGPEATAASAPRPTISRIKVSAEFRRDVDFKRQAAGLGWQELGHKLYEDWLAGEKPLLTGSLVKRIDEARGDTDFADFIEQLIEPSLDEQLIESNVGGHRIWWLTENVRKQLNFRLSPETPEYLQKALKHVYGITTRPRAQVYDLSGDLRPKDLPKLEVISGSNPRARWLIGEAPVGVVVRAADLKYLEHVPGVFSTFYPIQRHGKTIVEIGL